MKFSKQLRLSAGSLAVGLVLSSAPAFAQDADITSDGDESATAEDNQILVTGSRLNVNPNLEGANPVLSLSSEQIVQQGTVRIEDLVNQIPQVFAGQAGEVSNSATGTSTLDLRGLGPERTLVLIDGRRLPFGSSAAGGSSANLDVIPTQLIERIDVLTGGASAVYGSDAVAGVANFILRRDFEGVELDIQGGFQQHGNNIDFFENVLETAQQPIPGDTTDGAEYSFTGIIGANTADGRGNVTLFANYERREQVLQADRVFSACTLGSSGSGFEGVGCVGSANFRAFFNNEGLRDSLILDADGDPINAAFQELDGTIVPFAGGPAQTFNFGAQNFFQRPSERFNIYARGHYEISDNVEIFADLSYVDNISDAQIAETASFGAFTINCDNPFIQGTPGLDLAALYGCTGADIADGTLIPIATATHRNVEGGPRNSRLENSTFRIVGGLRGDFGDGVWSYEVFGQYSEASDTSVSTNDFIVSNLQQAFLAVDDGDGNVVCSDPSGGCVPYNPFQRNPDGTTLITQDQLDFIQGVGIVIGETTQLVAGANVQADLGEYGFKSPFSEEGIAFLVGVEYREDTLERIPDEISQVPGGGFTGVGGPTLPVEGSVDVYELFGELQIPLATNRPFFEELTLSGQYRYSDYTTDGNGTSNGFSTDAFGVQLVWAPVEDIRFRGQFQRAVRAPNVVELFTGIGTNLPNLNSGTNANGDTIFDPCATSAPTATFEQCANTGVTADQFGGINDVISGQTQSITSGNPDLQPESSDTYTFGVVFEPSFVPGLQISVDYFDITVEDFINAGIAAQFALDNCLETGEALFCDLITRGPGGTLASGFPGTGFDQTNINIAELETSGIDAQITYNTDIGSLGGLNFIYAATYLDTFDFTPFPDAAVVECAGFSDNACLNPVNSEYRHRATVTWQSNFNLDTTLTWRHFSSVDAFADAAEVPEQIDNNLESVNYFDLSFLYGVTDDITLRAGIINLFNDNPPISAAGGPPLGNGNTFPTVYDTGRQFFAGLNFRF
ncbi:TonB-dependent receptor domain-containing protein [Erythrobacter rubeus]|uniref:TonB-dependent receptor n=1 Tax=Erythrobacter rubeus TaxID=2760803 RepID=A0ABR8KU25_9SPHN|nr:TonB-dependent receptor [Erythrobacter rubeus]MBD2842568.1 TonB-dependent receptor [Erythrobacter rubeus]